MDISSYSYLFRFVNQTFVENIVTYNIDFLGHNFFVSNVFLNLPVCIKNTSQYKKYGHATGSGTSVKRRESICKAISESIERWAYYESIESNSKAFFIERSSAGMAAFPSFLVTSSRKIARQEAIEKYALDLFSKKRVRAYSYNKYEGVDSILIPIDKYHVCISSMKFKKDNVDRYAHGFSIDLNPDKSIYKSLYELQRNVHIIQESNDEESNLLSIYERRMMFYSYQYGNQKFEDLKKIALQSAKTSLFNIVFKFDAEIRGPWTKFAKVWRSVVDSLDGDTNNVEVFFF